MGVVYVSNLESGTVTGQTARSKGGKTSLVRQLSKRVILIHELGQLEDPKNSLIAAVTGLILIRDCGEIPSMSCVVIRSRTTRSIRDRPMRYWF